MIDILAITTPFFIIIFIGSFSCKMGWFTQEHGQTLARFAFFVVLPPFMFLSITNSPITASINVSFVFQYEISTIIIFFTAFIIARKFFSLSNSDPAMFALNASYPNYGYIGIPLCILAFGHKAAIPMALILVADTVVLLTLTAVSEAQSNSSSLQRSLKNVALSMGRNPLLLSVLLGFSALTFGITLPKTPILLLEILAGAAAPTALFALGVTLIGQSISSVKNEVGLLIVLKLAIHPILTALIFLSWSMIGFSKLDVVWIKVAILFSCLPIAANVFALSQFYKAYSGISAAAIMGSTIIASITVPLTLFFLKNLG